MTAPQTTTGIGGVMPALVTPLDEVGRLDRASLDRLLDHILAAPVSGVSPSGSTGEGPLLSRALRRELVSAVAARVPAGASVIAGAVSVNPEEVLADLEGYHAAGATAALVAPPFYYPIDDATVTRFYLGLAERSPLPLVLYNIPSMTKVTIAPGVVGELAGHPCVVGMKDSSRDFEYFQTVLSTTAGSEFALLTGSDTLLLASIATGGAGAIAAGINVVPALACSLYDAVGAGELAEANRLQAELRALVGACRRAGSPGGWKAACHLLGLCSLRCSEPLGPPSAEAIKHLAADLESLGVKLG